MLRKHCIRTLGLHTRLDHKEDGELRNCRNTQVRNLQGHLLRQTQNRQEKNMPKNTAKKDEGVKNVRNICEYLLHLWHYPLSYRWFYNCL